MVTGMGGGTGKARGEPLRCTVVSTMQSSCEGDPMVRQPFDSLGVLIVNTGQALWER